MEASNGQLNWALDLPMASWNCVNVVAGGGLEVRLGIKGDHKCGFSFATEITLADLVLVFGPTMAVLDVNSLKCSGKKIPFSFIVRTFALTLLWWTGSLMMFLRNFCR